MTASMSGLLLPGYQLRRGSELDRATLLKFMQRSYKELFPNQDFSHLATTIEQSFSQDTPVWWVELADSGVPGSQPLEPVRQPVACLWLGNVIDQVEGDRHAHIFLLYVMPEHRRRGLGSALMLHAENWARERGDRQIALHVFQSNHPAVNLYNLLGYQTQALWMVKPLLPKP